MLTLATIAFADEELPPPPTTQIFSDTPAAQQEPSPEEGLRGAARYMAEVERRTRELDLFDWQATDLYVKLIASYLDRESSRAIVRERDEAPIALREATDRALAMLRGSSTYERARGALIKAQARESALRDAGARAGSEPAAGEVTIAAAKAEVTRLEKQAVDTDPMVMAALQRQKDAEAAFTKLQQDAEAFAQADKELTELAKAVDDTLADLDAAAKDLDAAFAMEPKAGEFLDWELTEAIQDFVRNRPRHPGSAGRHAGDWTGSRFGALGELRGHYMRPVGDHLSAPWDQFRPGAPIGGPGSYGTR